MEQHAVPIGDLIAHEFAETDGDSCVCGPSVYFFPGGRLIYHHALDGIPRAVPVEIEVEIQSKEE